MKSDVPATRGPGLAKARADRLFLRRAVALWASVPGAIADLVRAADVVSEGGVREEDGARTYYGSTSLLFVPGPRTRDVAAAELRDRLASDPHVRLLALRVALREAAHRAGDRMGPASAEIAFHESPRGVVAVVDIAAKIGEGALRIA